MTRKARSVAKGTPLPGKPVHGSETGRPIMALLDLASRRGLLRIVWELRHGALKFRPLQRACGDVSPTLLNQRLKDLREARLIELTDEGYRLTALGQGLRRAFEPVSVWAEQWTRELALRSGQP